MPEPNALCTDASHLEQELLACIEIGCTMEVMPETCPQRISIVWSGTLAEASDFWSK